jgi:hypothetical protein
MGQATAPVARSAQVVDAAGWCASRFPGGGCGPLALILRHPAQWVQRVGGAERTAEPVAAGQALPQVRLGGVVVTLRISDLAQVRAGSGDVPRFLLASLLEDAQRLFQERLCCP